MEKILTKQRKICNWPPDAFAFAGYLLHTTGAYRKAVNNEWWGKVEPEHPQGVLRLGIKWRASASMGKPAPAMIQSRWNTVLKAHSLPISLIVKDCTEQPSRNLIRALFDLVAAADEACKGMGLPFDDIPEEGVEYSLYAKAENLLIRSTLNRGEASSLCENVDSEVVCVLPKMHTPQVGLTFRSLTHHLALCPRDEVVPVWNPTPGAFTSQRNAELNLLVVPYPYKIDKAQFVALKTGTQCGRHKLAHEFRQFAFDVKPHDGWLEKDLPQILEAARKRAPENRIDGVIFPELSLRGRGELISAYKQIASISPSAFLVAGVAEASRNGEKATHFNTAQFVVPILPGRISIYRQEKHHRWRLDKRQIKDYGIHAQLASGVSWWEQMNVAERELNFVALKQRLTCCVLVCEDLARQEPASRVVRAVAPTLLISLLMDGPQLRGRWPGRYVAVLGEDPGLAVLTLTSAGMVQLSNDNQKKRPKRSVVALWRDAEDSHEIPLARGAQAVLLSVQPVPRTEYSADGREDAKAGALVLKKEDIRQIKIKIVNHQKK